MRDLKRLGVKKYTSSKVRELTNTEAVLETEGESGPAELRIPCDTVVVCVGSICNRGLYEALAGSMEHVHIIGDAEKIGKVMDAIRQAVDLAEAHVRSERDNRAAPSGTGWTGRLYLDHSGGHLWSISERPSISSMVCMLPQ